MRVQFKLCSNFEWGICVCISILNVFSLHFRKSSLPNISRSFVILCLWLSDSTYWRYVRIHNTDFNKVSSFLFNIFLTPGIPFTHSCFEYFVSFLLSPRFCMSLVDFHLSFILLVFVTLFLTMYVTSPMLATIQTWHFVPNKKVNKTTIPIKGKGFIYIAFLTNL